MTGSSWLRALRWRFAEKDIEEVRDQREWSILKNIEERFIIPKPHVVYLGVMSLDGVCHG